MMMITAFHIAFRRRVIVNMSQNNTSLGMEENLESALSYVLGPITGIFFLIAEKENINVRFHAMQSTIFLGILFVLEIVVRIFSNIPILGIIFGLAGWALNIIALIAIVYLALNALQGKILKVPYIGEVAWNQVNK